MHHKIAIAAIKVGQIGSVGGTTWDATRNSVSAGSFAPVYIVPERPSALEKAFSQSAATLRTRWKLIANTVNVATLATGDTLTSATDSSLIFLVTSLDREELPTVTIGTLERQPYS